MQKPEPQANADSRPYWEACRREELIYQFCEECGKAQFYPRGRCVHCSNATLKWLTSAGGGRIYALTEVHVGQRNNAAPYYLAMIEMDEGFKIMTNIVSGGKGASIGRRGHIVFESRGESKIPQFVVDP
jgi:hypothetical protein